MFEFEDNDFTLMESFPLSADEKDCADYEGGVLVQGTYLGDGVWVVDTNETAEEIERVHSRVSES
ncbi:MAG: hypothetical protein ABI700_19170 [Chloroflexota bacterium]